MADTSYQPKVYRKQGGNELVVASGGKLNIEDGGILEVDGEAVTATALQLNALVAGEDTDLHSHIPAAGSITLPMLAAPAQLAAIVAAGLGKSVAVDHGGAGSPATLVAANVAPAGDRAVLAIAICSEDVAGETPPTFALGETGAAEKFFAAATLAEATEGEVFVAAGLLTEEKALIATWTAGSGTEPPPAGAFSFLVLVLPVASGA